MRTGQDILDKINRAIVEPEDIERVNKVLKSGFLSKPDGGPDVVELQNIIAKAHTQKYAFAVNSGTSALHCAVSALELKEGDEVLLPALANMADPSVVIQERANPVFVDVDPDDFNIDPQKLEAKITDKTKAIIVVHMYGQPVKIAEIKAIAARHGLPLIEDCAQAAGARYDGQYVGSFGDISCFSTYQTKHIVSGEGGLVVTSNENYAKIIGSVANNGIMKEDLDAYDYDRLGYNYQMTEIQAALAIGQFRKLDSNNQARRANVAKYKQLLSDLDITFQASADNTENVYFYLAGLLPESMNTKRDEFLDAVKKLQIPIKKLYPLALTELTFFEGKVEQDCDVAQAMTKRVFNLYVNPGLDEEDVEFMANGVRQAYLGLCP